MRILAISGSLRGGSLNASLLRALAQEFDDSHAWHQLDTGVLKGLPAYDEDDEATFAGHSAVTSAREELAAADVVVIATPEYNGSVPGALKNLVDWVSRPVDSNPLRGKPVAVVSASTGQFGAVWANNDLRRILGTLGARSLERQVAVPSAHLVFNEDGLLVSEGIRRQLGELAADVQAAMPAAVTAA